MMASLSARAQLEKQKKIKEDAEERIKVLTKKVKQQDEDRKKRVAKKIGEETIKLLGRDVTDQDAEVHIAILRDLEEQDHYYTERMNNPEKYGLLPDKSEEKDIADKQTKNQAEGQTADDSGQIEIQAEGQTAEGSEEMPF